MEFYCPKCGYANSNRSDVSCSMCGYVWDERAYESLKNASNIVDETKTKKEESEKTQKTEEGVKIIQADALLAKQVNAQTLKHARLFMDGLKAFNFEPMWENTDGKTLVHLAIDDKDRIVCLFDGDNGQLFKAFAIVDGVPADKVTEALKLCNELNTKYMWAKFSVGPGQNGNKGIHLGIEALLADADTAAQAIALLLKFIDVCEAEISNIRSFTDNLNVASQTERNIKKFNDALREKAEKEKAKQQKIIVSDSPLLIVQKTGASTAEQIIEFDFSNEEQAGLDKLNSLLSTMKLDKLKLENYSGSLSTTTDKYGNIVNRSYLLRQGVLKCELSKENLGYQYRIETTTANRNEDNEAVIQNWRNIHPDRIVRSASINEIDDALGCIIIHHQKEELQNNAGNTAMQGEKIIEEKDRQRIEKIAGEDAEARKAYAYLVPYYNRYKENHPNETFGHYVQWAKAFTPVDFPTPSADPYCSHGEDPNKFSGEMRLAKNGEGYIALWR